MLHAFESHCSDFNFPLAFWCPNKDNFRIINSQQMSIQMTCYLVTLINPCYKNNTEVLTSCLCKYAHGTSILTSKYYSSFLERH